MLKLTAWDVKQRELRGLVEAMDCYQLKEGIVLTAVSSKKSPNWLSLLSAILKLFKSNSR
jgi:hypothetical protein